MVVSKHDPSAVRRKRSLVSVAVAGGIVAIAASMACVENRGSLVILGVLAPPTLTGTAGAVCLYTPTQDGPYLSYGTLDVAFAEQYVPTILVGNQMVATGNPGQFRVETNRVEIEGSIVRITDASGTQLTSYTVLGSGFVDASSGGTMGLGSVGTTLIDPSTVDAVRQALGTTIGASKRLVSYVKVYGTTTGGQHIESGEFSFPINACLGCLVTFPSGSSDPQAALPNCLGSSSGGGSTISTPCVYGQDQGIDCRLCQTNPVCIP